MLTITAAKAAFATRLIALRQAFGASIGKPRLTQREFAEMLNLQAETYGRYERAETEPNVLLLTRPTECLNNAYGQPP